MITDPFANDAAMAKDVLAELGTGKVAYVKKVTEADLHRMFPGAEIEGMDGPVWALLSANGSPILLADSRDAAIANAMEQDLKTVSLH
ncbi:MULTISPECIES: DUF1150 domain-containing protein [Pseudovibrio]|uniref:BQ00720 family protein n=1 Tax=Stappiaceae TaxID=2821832 RepID=UPI002364FCA9|nr:MULTISPECIES: DUF1150 domain-containing protein [Pseudovibrio]MDD7909806.1 DUF1150 domain-containing protein [Pseudovibrio exalbescens]MDX5592146.1 DUF1150 domain-containing protein [Pseudovibrio sp. SPO723]